MQKKLKKNKKKVFKINSKKEIFSFSKLNTFKQCPYRYKLRYIDKVKSDRQSVEAYNGKLIHNCLEKLYLEKLNMKELLQLYDENYNLTNNIFIIRKERNYKKEGLVLLENYYSMFFKTDNTLTISTEYELRGKIVNKEFTGFIDRLSKSDDNNNIIFINDYKTGKTMKKLKNDLQAKIYTILLKKKLKNYKIQNRWYYLRYGNLEKIEYNNGNLIEAENKIGDLINEIGKEVEFKKTHSPLCRWCEYSQICKI